MILEATHTHLYPGHRGKICGLAQIADLNEGCDCLVGFADGSAASARMSRTANGWQLYTDAYRTAAGTVITERLWVVLLQEDNSHIEFHILSKAPGKQ